MRTIQNYDDFFYNKLKFLDDNDKSDDDACDCFEKYASIIDMAIKGDGHIYILVKMGKLCEIRVLDGVFFANSVIHIAERKCIAGSGWSENREIPRQEAVDRLYKCGVYRDDFLDMYWYIAGMDFRQSDIYLKSKLLAVCTIGRSKKMFDFITKRIKG